MKGSDEESTHRTIERVARESYGRLVAYPSSHKRTTWPPRRMLSATRYWRRSRSGREMACRKIPRPGC